MLDIKYIRENFGKLKKAIRDKNIDLDLDRLLMLDKKRREMIKKIEDLRTEKKKLNDIMFGVGSGLKPEPEENSRKKGSNLRLEPTMDKESIIEKGKLIKNQIAKIEPDYKMVEGEYGALMAKIPTIPSEDTPVGKSDKDNKEVYRKGKIPQFDFKPKTHIELGKSLDILDLERGVKVGGYRGYYLKNEGVMLVMGLMMHALSKMIKKGYAPMIPPTLVKEFVLFGSGYFKGLEYNSEVDEIYQIATRDKEVSGETSKEKKFLVGTAEPSLLAYYANEILDESRLPLRICGFSPCYRSEIGSYGKDTKGMYRVHEFMKVEQVIITGAKKEETNRLQEEMLGISEELHKDLGLPYRKLQICTGDMGVGKYKMFDLEAWLPGLDRWGETGSASNFLDWQARRLNVKYVNKKSEKKYVYMLNNTALATPRTFIAILENYQQADGSVKVPEVLVKYVGKEIIEVKTTSKNLKVY